MVTQFIRIFIINVGLASFLAAEPAVDIKTIKQSIICTCDCNMTVETCEGSMSCLTAKKLAEEGEFLIKNNLSEAQILNVFVMRYGEEILASPTKSGFNLMAWVLPFLVLGAVGFGVTQLLHRWAHPVQQTYQIHPSGKRRSSDRKYEKQLDEILKELD
jgi:cytochrome c-type biogenesis protein CcmH